MLKKIAIAGGLVLSAILIYIVGLNKHDVFNFYIFCFVMMVAAFLGILLILAMSLIWWLLPASLKKTYEGRRRRFNVIIFFSVLLFYIVAGVFGEICPPDASGFIRLLGYTTIFVFAAFLGWSLIRRSTGETIVIGSVVFILFIALLSFFSFTAVKSGRTAEVNPVRKLISLGYVGVVPAEAEKDIDKIGVIQYDPELASDGLNIYSSEILEEAHLIDMHGNIVHKWTKKADNCPSWGQHVEMCENGDLLVVADGKMLIQLDWDSKVKWWKKIGIHHDVCVDENKKNHILALKRELVFWRGILVPIYSNYIVVLSPQGEVEKEISVYDMVKEQIPLSRIVKIYIGFLKIFKPKNVFRMFMLRFSECKNDILKENSTDTSDILHSNSIEVMDRDIEGFCSKGDWLISIREIDLVGIVDTKKEKLVWSWGPSELSQQHHPTLLENGNMLIFDNGCIRGASRIVELNPLTRKIVWEYKSKPPEQFYSEKRGCNQRLPNGNTLITESDKGYVFEVTKEGKLVWDFYNPNIEPEHKERETIYRMMRITRPEINKLIKRCTFSAGAGQ